MGMLWPTDRGVFDRLALYDIRRIDGRLVSGALTLPEARKRAEGLLNLAVALVPQGDGFGTEGHRAVAALWVAKRGERPADLRHHAWGAVRGARDAVRFTRNRSTAYHEFHGGWSRPEVDRRRFDVIEIHASAEQTMSADNRVMLDDQRDRLEWPRAKVRFSWSQEDRDNVARSCGLVAEALTAASFGRFEPWATFDGPGRPLSGGIHHPMGGTRMDPDPRHGVVDADARVHGLENLYVSGSSVFASGLGYANPTLTLLALSIRLADHLKDRGYSGG